MNHTVITIAEALQTARKAGLNRISDLQALIHLAGVNHATASNLAAETGVSTAAATQLIDRLADRRLVLTAITAITAKGRELITPFLP